MDIALISEISFHASQIISILACIWFIHSNSKLQKTTLAMRMIKIFGISNLVFHSIVLAYPHLPVSISGSIGRFVINISLRFSIFWSSSVSLLVYKSLTKDGITNQEQYFKLSLFYMIFSSIALSAV